MSQENKEKNLRSLIKSSLNQESSQVSLSGLISELATMAPECATLEKCNDIETITKLLGKIRVFELRLAIFKEDIECIKHEFKRVN